MSVENGNSQLLFSSDDCHAYAYVVNLKCNKLFIYEHCSQFPQSNNFCLHKQNTNIFTLVSCVTRGAFWAVKLSSSNHPNKRKKKRKTFLLICWCYQRPWVVRRRQLCCSKASSYDTSLKILAFNFKWFLLPIQYFSFIKPNHEITTWTKQLYSQQITCTCKLHVYWTSNQD